MVLLVGCGVGLAPALAIPIGLTSDGVEVAAREGDVALLCPDDGLGGPEVVAVDAVAFFWADMLCCCLNKLESMPSRLDSSPDMGSFLRAAAISSGNLVEWRCGESNTQLPSLGSSHTKCKGCLQ